MISTGEHTLGIRQDGSLWAWGHNSFGELGLGVGDGIGAFIEWSPGNFYYAGKEQFSPMQVGTDTDWAHIEVGDGCSLGIREDGTLWAWGRNVNGTLGLGSDIDLVATPTQVGTDNDWKCISISSSSVHVLGIRKDGTLWAWGNNGGGQLGLGVGEGIGTLTEYSWAWHFDGEHQFSPVQVGDFTDWIHISGSNQRTFGIRADGSLWVWGQDGTWYGTFGIGDIIPDYLLTPFGPTPEQLEPLPIEPDEPEEQCEECGQIDCTECEDEPGNTQGGNTTGGDDPPPPPNPNRNPFSAFAIPTAIAICIAFVALITLIVMLITRRREERKNKQKIKPTS